MEGDVNRMDVNSKEKLFACITATSFVMDDLRLFLDTHPTDRAALDYWDRVMKVRNEAVHEYTKCYGPIEMYHVDSENRWEWVEGPWPWEGRC
jgi:spore coat protein JB